MTEVCCSAEVAGCSCMLHPHHRGPHTCLCGSEWVYDLAGRWDVVTLPQHSGMHPKRKRRRFWHKRVP